MEVDLLRQNEEVYRRKHEDVTHLLNVLEGDELFSAGLRNIQNGASKENPEMIASLFGLIASGGMDINTNLDVHVLLSQVNNNATNVEVYDVRHGTSLVSGNHQMIIGALGNSAGGNYYIHEHIQESFEHDPYLNDHDLNSYIGSPIIDENSSITGVFALMIDKNLDDEIDFWGQKVLVKNVLPLLSVIMSSSIAQGNMTDKSNKLQVDALIAENIAYGLNAHAVETLQHCHSSADRALAIAKALNINDTEDLANLRTAAEIHDLGKHGVPTRVLEQPDKLSDVEFELMKNHTIVGERIARLSGVSDKVIQIIRGHHLRWDGKGYPDNTAGNKIPILAQIMKVADVIDARLENRAYHDPMEVRELLNSLLFGSGTEFSPNVVNAIYSCSEEIYDEIFKINTLSEVPIEV